MEYKIEHRTLHFKRPAGTSRGIYRTRDVWYIHLSEGEWHGTGECAPLPDLSCDALPHDEYEQRIDEACHLTCQLGYIDYEHLRDFPSILFGLESALATNPKLGSDPNLGFAPSYCDLREMGSDPNSREPLCRINGLIWMGTYEEMKARLEEKLQAGFRCIKLKIGAINFDDELNLIRQVRRDFSRERVELRVDANGGFGSTYDEAIGKLHQLAAYDIHSIEQPIRQGHWQEMAKLCQETPLPIALDEELIGINQTEKKVELLDTIRPQYIILKPSLHGGFRGCDEWIRLAEERHIPWWATSALESNVGLGAIARWVAQYRPTLPQGLGTGLLFEDNTPPETEVRGDELYLIK